jgi:hypothetical protein
VKVLLVFATITFLLQSIFAAAPTCHSLFENRKKTYFQRDEIVKLDANQSHTGTMRIGSYDAQAIQKWNALLDIPRNELRQNQEKLKKLEAQLIEAAATADKLYNGKRNALKVFFSALFRKEAYTEYKPLRQQMNEYRKTISVLKAEKKRNEAEIQKLMKESPLGNIESIFLNPITKILQRSAFEGTNFDRIRIEKMEIDPQSTGPITTYVFDTKISIGANEYPLKLYVKMNPSRRAILQSFIYHEDTPENKKNNVFDFFKQDTVASLVSGPFRPYRMLGSQYSFARLLEKRGIVLKKETIEAMARKRSQDANIRRHSDEVIFYASNLKKPAEQSFFESYFYYNVYGPNFSLFTMPPPSLVYFKYDDVFISPRENCGFAL